MAHTNRKPQTANRITGGWLQWSKADVAKRDSIARREVITDALLVALGASIVGGLWIMAAISFYVTFK